MHPGKQANVGLYFPVILMPYSFREFQPALMKVLKFEYNIRWIIR